MKLVIDLPSAEQQRAFNRKRWQEVVADPELARLPYRIETNVFGQIVMNPPPSGEHGHRQAQIAILLNQILKDTVITECPISTTDGVKAADVGWYSNSRFAEVRGQLVFEKAPEICVEVLSQSNTKLEMQVKRQLYFTAGAEEVWLCDLQGVMSYYTSEQPNAPRKESPRCPSFPPEIE